MSDALLSDADVGLAPVAAAPAGANSGLLSDADVGLGGESARMPSSMNSTIAAPAIGFNRGLADVAGAPVDATTWLMKKAGLYPQSGSPTLSSLVTESAPPAPSPFMGSDWIKQNILGSIGANPDTSEHAPRSGLESVLQSSGDAAAQMVAPELGVAGAAASGVKIAPSVAGALDSTFGSASSLPAVAKNAAIGAVGGGAGEAAAQQFDPNAHPYWAAGARLAGNLVGGGLTAAATEVNPWNMVKSFKAPLTDEGQAQLAGQQLRDAATSPTAAIDTIENAPRELVPGSQPTTFQLTGDMGLGALERRVQTQNPALFNEARAGQNQARVDALNNIQATGSPEDVSAALRTKLNALSAQADADVGTATTNAQQQAGALGGNQSPGFYGEQIRGQIQPQLDAAKQNAAAASNALGGTGSPETYGAALRDPLAAAKQSAQQARSALYKAVDPTGSLNVVATTLRDAGDAAAAKLSPMAAQPSGEEAAIMGTLQGLPDVVPFNDLQALDARVTAAMSAERRTAGETPVWGRLSQMKGAVQDAIDNGVSNQVAYERSQVASGAIAPDEALETRLQAWNDESARQQSMGERVGEMAQAPGGASVSTSQGSGTGNRGFSGETSGSGAAASSRVFPATGEAVGRPGNTAGDQGISSQDIAGSRLGAPAPGRAPMRLTRFIAANGGLRPDPELTAVFDKENPFVPGMGRLIQKKGMSLDDARGAATQAGYIYDPGETGRGPLETDINDFLDLLAKDHAGDHQFPLGEESTARQDALDFRAHESYLRKELKGEGINPNTVGRRVLNSAVDMMRTGEEPDPLIAFERAVMQDSDNFEVEHAARQRDTGRINGYDVSDDSYGAPPREFAPASDEGGYAGTRGSSGANGPQPYSGGESGRAQNSRGNAPSALAPNFNEEAAARLAQAKSAHAQYAQTYRQGPVGAALKTNGFAGQYKMPNAAVPEQVFAKGPKGFESGIAYRNAVKDDPAAVSAARNYAAMTLRRVAENPDGTINPGKFSSWKAAYGDALRAYPGLAQKFSTAAKASEELGKFAPFRADMAPYDVPEVFFHSGAGGKEGVDNLRRLIGDHHAQAILQDYAASKLKSTAMRQDGTLDPAKVARFQQAHADALQSFPALNAKFSTAAKASDAIDEAAAARKKTLDAFQAGSIGKIMNSAPEDVTKHIGAIFGQKDASTTMARLASQAKSGGPAAVAGLRKAIADHITSKFVSNTEAGTSGTNLVKSDQFQTFLKANKPALSKVFSPEEIASMEAIAADLHRANRTITAVKIPGSPGTAQDRTAVEWAARHPEGSLLNALLVGGGLGFEAHGLHGAIAGATLGAVKHVVSAARAAGYDRVDELVRDAMLDPDLAAQLLKKAPVVAGRQDGVSLGQKLMRVGAYSAANQMQGRASGGRVAAAEPTEMQKIAGNYRKGHLRIHGLDVTIENPKGSYRSGIGSDGKAWRVRMPNHYGYVRGTVGADGDHVDAYIGPHDNSDKVFVVDQKDLQSGKFDEHKVMLGFRNREAAIGGYCNGFSDGKGSKRMMKITPMSVDEFKAWLASGNTRNPISKAA